LINFRIQGVITMKFVKGNILDAEYGVIVNPVSCAISSEWSEIGQSLRLKYPIAFSEYQNIIIRVPNIVNRLGLCQLVEAVPRNLFIANMFIAWGKVTIDKPAGSLSKHPSIEVNSVAASASGLKNWLRSINIKDFPIYFPHNEIFSDSKIKTVIKYHIPDAIMVRQL